eukprot:Phypoly_transcript_18066.p1 GENE.Phypoly_transcript_18066~~Phypoly_transcript_18066.p1  ORF type:complete len:251 (+),score=35.48 Phypoly_transcript_18066:62-754(+)
MSLSPFMFKYGSRAVCGITTRHISTPCLVPVRNTCIRRASNHAAWTSAFHGTTILSVRRNNKVVIMGDGQISRGDTVVKGNAKKVRRIGKDVIAGFAGATADCLTLFDLLEQKLEEHRGQLLRSCVELAKAWRTDKFLRKLEAIMIVADRHVTLTLTGNGDVIEPNDGVVAVGSGGDYALAAARGIVAVAPQEMDPEEIVKKAMTIASEMCVYTNNNFTTEVITWDPQSL